MTRDMALGERSRPWWRPASALRWRLSAMVTRHEPGELRPAAGCRAGINQERLVDNGREASWADRFGV